MATLSEVNGIHGKVSGWWYDTFSTIHVTYDRSLFKTIESSKEGHVIQMGNEKRSMVEGNGILTCSSHPTRRFYSQMFCMYWK